MVGSTTAQIYSEFDRTTPAPLLCQGGEFSLKPFRWAKPLHGNTLALEFRNERTHVYALEKTGPQHSMNLPGGKNDLLNESPFFFHIRSGGNWRSDDPYSAFARLVLRFRRPVGHGA